MCSDNAGAASSAGGAKVGLEATMSFCALLLIMGDLGNVYTHLGSYFKHQKQCA